MNTIIFGAIHLKIDQLFCLELLSTCYCITCFMFLSSLHWIIKYETMFPNILVSSVNVFKISMRRLLLTLKVLASVNVKRGSLALVIVAGIQVPS